MHPFDPGRLLATPTGATFPPLGCSGQPGRNLLPHCGQDSGSGTPHVQRWPLSTYLATLATPKSRGRETLCVRGVCVALNPTDHG